MAVGDRAAALELEERPLPSHLRTGGRNSLGAEKSAGKDFPENPLAMRRAFALLLLAVPLSAIPEEPDAAALVAAPQVLVSDLSERLPISFLKVKLIGNRSNRDGLGATVRVVAAGKTYTRLHDGKSGYLSQSAMPLYFGLGSAKSVERVEVVWPSGARSRREEGISPNALVEMREPR